MLTHDHVGDYSKDGDDQRIASYISERDWPFYQKTDGFRLFSHIFLFFSSNPSSLSARLIWIFLQEEKGRAIEQGEGRGRERERERKWERDRKRTTFGTFATSATQLRTVMNIYLCQGTGGKKNGSR